MPLLESAQVDFDLEVDKGFNLMDIDHPMIRPLETPTTTHSQSCECIVAHSHNLVIGYIS